MASKAAFFDLDRRLLAGSSALALADEFHRRGLLSRRELIQAGVWQLFFTRYGASPAQAKRMVGRGLERLRGLRTEELQAPVASSLTPVLTPRLYREALALLDEHRARGERVYLVSATIEELVAALAGELGLDGGSEPLPKSSTAVTRAGRSSAVWARTSWRRCGDWRIRTGSTSPARPPTPIAPPMSLSWRRSARRWPSTPIAGCAPSPTSAAGSCSRSEITQRELRGPQGVMPCALIDHMPARKRWVGRAQSIHRLVFGVAVFESVVVRTGTAARPGGSHPPVRV